MTHQEKTDFFNENYEIFNTEIEKRRRKWNLKANLSLDFDDVKQICLRHLYVKLDLYDANKSPLSHWSNSVISSQISNILRNNFYSCARPCVQKGGCWFNTGGDSCLYTPSGLQCSECPIFSAWEKGKKSAHNVKMALPICNHEVEVFDIPNNELNYDRAEIKFHEEMKKVLKKHEWVVYEMIFIFNMTDMEVADKMKWKTKEKHRRPGYGNLIRLKKIFIEKARKIKEEVDLF